MKHLGDITKINGAEIEPVDCITGGSPCQDLSVAGKRAGLAGERSGLFMEQIRIVKEMREHERRIRGTDDDFRLRPRYMVWENVPGAFSSNKGQDFQAVLTEIVRIVRPDAPDVPLPDRGGWSKSGCIMGYGSTGCPFSIAWRLHDAQFWGVPQRRKRIALVADFGGLSAPEICFERKGLSRDIEPCGTEREGSAGATSDRVTTAICLQGNGIDRADTAGCNGRGWNDQDVSYTLNTIDRPAVYAAGFDGNMGAKAGNIGFDWECSPTLNAGKTMNTLCLNDQGGSVMNVTENISGTLRAQEHGHQPVVAVHQNASGEVREGDVAYTVGTNSNASGRNTPMVFEPRSQDGVPRIHEDGVVPTLNTAQGGQRQPCVVCVGNGQLNQISMAEQSNTLDTMHDQQAVMVLNDQGGSVMDVSHDSTATLRAQSHGHEPAVMISAVDCRNASEDPNINATLQANPKTVNNNNVCRIGSQVRRLTPLECERLQGFPDGWTDIGEWVDSKGKKHKESDSPRYKALGNSIAVGYANNGSGFWMWLLKRISAQYERNATLGSLFDGIGGFPLAWEHFNGKGSARWASEIEEFPIAVTKKHFPEPE